MVKESCQHTKVFISGSDDIINKYSVLPEPISQRETRLVPKMKMREKTKLKTIEEIPLEELESHVRDDGELSFDFGHLMCSKSYANYHM